MYSLNEEESSTHLETNITTDHHRAAHFTIGTSGQPDIIVSKPSPKLHRNILLRPYNSFDNNDGDLKAHQSTFKALTRKHSVDVQPTANRDILPNRDILQNRNNESWNKLLMMNRQASVSSLCSIDTSCTSDFSDFDSEELSPALEDNATPPKKESMWVKVRKIVRWQPFMQNYKKQYPWIQLAGHSGGFKSGENGTILKKSVKKEVEALQKLMTDPLKTYVPEFKAEVMEDGDLYIQMQDLLQEFDHPSFVMDCKMGTRTYLEEEVNKEGKPRKDLYEKMVSVDPSEPTDSENESCCCTKSRYMQWREQLSSTATLGFRIEGIKRGENAPDKDFKKVRSEEDIAKVFTRFIEHKPDLQMKYLERLKEIKETLLNSSFFKSHEIVGSSLLFIHDSKGKAGIWLIDFGKTCPLTNGHTIDHKTQWTLGNHEDGYLIGLDNITKVWSNLTCENIIEKT